MKRLLIANRGEIALRIVREAMALGIAPIVCASEADARDWSLTEVARIGSYLDAEAIIAAARAHKADAVHPGYGFLSENADFAQAVIDADLIWVGPPPSAIRAMADKGAAKRIARSADVPCIPGYDGEDQSDARLLAEAETIGWPVLIKAALGGGGRGQRVVTRTEAFAEALAGARREALSGFGSDAMILEKALTGARHVEVQIFGDAQGRIVHMGTRDCSVQRRNQKIIEEAPAPGLPPGTEAAMCAAAARLAKAVAYTNAGTVEFLLEPSGAFWFLEMNTRIQVEHPVTEAITGLNLIALQLRVAQGEALPFSQDDVRFDGHAIEARLCAEDPGDGYKPQTGTLWSFGSFWAAGRPDNVRIDEAPGRGVSGHYDSMIAKVIAHGRSREAALETLAEALTLARLPGLLTNRGHLVSILRDADFASGAPDIGWLTRRGVEACDDERLARAAAVTLANARPPWSSTGARTTPVRLRLRERVLDCLVQPHERTEIKCETREAFVHVFDGARDALFEDVTYAPAVPKEASDGLVRTPLAGKLVAVQTQEGRRVAKGDVLFIVESMKMEHELRAPKAGVVTQLTVAAGDQLGVRQTLCALSD
jgi:acetyl/propionyl-CoA carboxylase alpha subunit